MGRQYPPPATGFTAARYCEPLEKDYHLRLKRRAREISALIRARHPGSRSRVCVDSAPLLERSFAYASGIGFIGKNNMLIVPGHGSYLFLAEVLTTAPIPVPARGPMESLCGPCTRCVEACPTGALEGPFRLGRITVPFVPDHRRSCPRIPAHRTGHGNMLLRLRPLPGGMPLQRPRGGARCARCLPAGRSCPWTRSDSPPRSEDTALAPGQGSRRSSPTYAPLPTFEIQSPAGSNGTGGAHGA